MKVVSLHSKQEVEAFARRNPLLHLYEIGDLDDFFWPYTVWYAARDEQGLRQLALLYTDLSMPVILAHAEPPRALMGDLFRSLLPLLPRRFYGHLGEEAVAALRSDYNVRSHGMYLKMGLADEARLDGIVTAPVVALSEADTE